MISWGREAACGLRGSVFLAWSTGKALEHKLHHCVNFPGGPHFSWPLTVGCPTSRLIAPNSWGLFSGEGAAVSHEQPMFTAHNCVGAHLAKGIWVESCNGLDHSIFLCLRVFQVGPLSAWQQMQSGMWEWRLNLLAATLHQGENAHLLPLGQTNLGDILYNPGGSGGIEPLLPMAENTLRWASCFPCSSLLSLGIFSQMHTLAQALHSRESRLKRLRQKFWTEPWG